MPRLDPVVLIKRIEELMVVQSAGTQQGDTAAAVMQQFYGAVRVANVLYGENCWQTQKLSAAELDARNDRMERGMAYRMKLRPVIVGALQAMKGDIEHGLVGDIEQRAAGVVLADLLGLAKEALSDAAPGTSNVAAVLTAAAFEDTIRRMGAKFAAVTDRRDLSQVIDALKIAGTLTGASLTTALGFLKFRNDALHADWSKLKAPVISSCLAFTERLLQDHFS